MQGNSFELGIYTFAELTPDPVTGRIVGSAERLRDLLDEIELADRVGLDVFGVGEHHRPDFAVSAPAVVLAAAAERTSRIRLTSAVSVLGSDDPVRVFQDFATLDLLSGGRAEIMAGRGSFIESFPLFGYDLRDYDGLFAEKLDLLLAVRERRARDLVGHASSLTRGPRRLPAAVAGSAARLGGGRRHAGVGRPGGRARSAARARRSSAVMPERFAPLARAPPARGARGRSRPRLPSASTRTASSRTPPQAGGRRLVGPFAAMMNRIGRERGWPPMTRERSTPHAHCAVRTSWARPQEVVEKILFQHEIFGHQRFLLQLSVGTVAHDRLMRAIELFGTEVAPAVRKALRPPQRLAGRSATLAGHQERSGRGTYGRSASPV